MLFFYFQLQKQSEAQPQFFFFILEGSLIQLIILDRKLHPLNSIP